MTVHRYDNFDHTCVWTEIADQCGWPGTIWLGRIRLCVTHYEAARRAQAHDIEHDSFIYFARIGDYIKIGRSRNVGSRVKRLQFDLNIKRPDDLPQGRLTLLHAFPAWSGHEDSVHQAFLAEHVTGEWFHASPNLLAYIDSLIANAPTPAEQSA